MDKIKLFRFFKKNGQNKIISFFLKKNNILLY